MFWLLNRNAYRNGSFEQPNIFLGQDNRKSIFDINLDYFFMQLFNFVLDVQKEPPHCNVVDF